MYHLSNLSRKFPFKRMNTRACPTMSLNNSRLIFYSRRICLLYGFPGMNGVDGHCNPPAKKKINRMWHLCYLCSSDMGFDPITWIKSNSSSWERVPWNQPTGKPNLRNLNSPSWNDVSFYQGPQIPLNDLSEVALNYSHLQIIWYVYTRWIFTNASA